jgi:hypothetical protein
LQLSYPSEKAVSLVNVDMAWCGLWSHFARDEGSLPAVTDRDGPHFLSTYLDISLLELPPGLRIDGVTAKDSQYLQKEPLGHKPEGLILTFP